MASKAFRRASGMSVGVYQVLPGKQIYRMCVKASATRPWSRNARPEEIAAYKVALEQTSVVAC